jgi:pSer/pThr/pTyr-binding forkhead associated (FHA) protein
MECPNCHHWNETNARFCEDCGQELVAEEVLTTVPAQVSIAAPNAAVPDAARNGLPDELPEPQLLIPLDPPTPPAAPAYAGALLILESTGSIFKLGDTTLIGREGPAVQIDFDGYQDGKYISHHHAQVTSHDDTYFVEDLNSSNHTWVNGIKLSPGQAEPLHDGDKVRLGKIELLFRASPKS